MGSVVVLTESLDEMKWECLAIVLETPLTEEWVSTFRICFQVPVSLKFILSHLVVFVYFCFLGNSVGMDRMNTGMDRLGSNIDRMGGMGMDRMERVSDLDRLGSGFDRMGSGMDRLGPSLGSSMDRLGPGGFDRLGPSSLDRMGSSVDFSSTMGMDRMGSTGIDRMGSNFDRMGSTGGLDRFSSSGFDRMSSGMDRMGSGGVGGQFDRSGDLDRGFVGNSFGGAGGPGAGAGNVRKGCQIFVRNVSAYIILGYIHPKGFPFYRSFNLYFVFQLPFDFTWKMLKDTFNTCGKHCFSLKKINEGSRFSDPV